jgi:L-ascorbate metabolism protein UlaG (beta-lactamase superfamily)
MDAKVSCFGQTTVCLEISKKRIYFDPYNIADRKLKKATHIFLSGIYANKADIAALTTKKTKIYCPSALAKELEAVSPEIVAPGIKTDEFDVIPAYAVGEMVTLEKKIYNGYLVKEGKESFYFAGPTDVIPEMNLITTTVAFLPVDGICDVFAAIAATNVIAAELFVPIAYAKKTEEGLLSCKRFSLKCPHPTELFRKKEDVFEPKAHPSNSI